MQNIQRIYIFTLLWLASLTLNAQVTATITHVKAPNKGSITLQMNSGTAPYTYEWYKKATPNTIIATSKDLTNLDAGEYCVIIHDAKCCSAEQCFTIKDECSGDYAKVSYKKNSSDCGSGQTTPATNGKIEIDVPNPADYTYCWKEFPNEPTCRFTTQNIDQIGIGTYYLTVTNINTGCKVTLETKICCCYDDSFELEDPNSTPHPFACSNNQGFGTPLDVVATPTPPTNATGGSIDLNITGGQSSNYTIKWTGPPGFHSADASINNLAPGKYCYTVTDGCTEESDCFDMYVCGDNPINIVGVLTRPCDAGIALSPKAYGKISITISGGKGFYKYRWSNGSPGSSITQLRSGTYSVIVTDKSGCTQTATFNLANVDVTQRYVTCAIIETCVDESRELRKRYFDPTWEDDPIDCTKEIGRCHLTKEIMTTRPKANPPGDVLVDNSCNIWWVCPNGFKKIIGNGIPKSTTSFEFDPLCNCGACIKTDFCDFLGQNIKTIRRVRVSPTSGQTVKTGQCTSGCGQQVMCGNEVINIACLPATYCGGGKAAPTIVFNSNITLGDYILGNYQQEDRIFFEEDRIFVPRGVTAKTTMTDLEIITAETSENPNQEYVELEFREYIPTVCEKRTCEYKTLEANSVSNSKISAKPDIISTQIKTYPNPAEDLLNIEVPYKLYPKSKIQILNALGQVVFTKSCSEESAIKVDVSSFATGAYTVNVFDCDNNQVYNNKFIKQ